MFESLLNAIKFENQSDPIEINVLRLLRLETLRFETLKVQDEDKLQTQLIGDL